MPIAGEKKDTGDVFSKEPRKKLITFVAKIRPCLSGFINHCRAAGSDHLEGGRAAFQFGLEPFELAFSKHRGSILRFVWIPVRAVVEHEEFNVCYPEPVEDARHSCGLGVWVRPVTAERLDCEISPLECPVGVVRSEVMVVPDAVAGCCGDDVSEPGDLPESAMVKGHDLSDAGFGEIISFRLARHVIVVADKQKGGRAEPRNL